MVIRHNRWRVCSQALSLALAVGAICVLASCGPKKSSNTPAGPKVTMTLTGVGATFPQPLYAKWIEMYKETNPSLGINYQANGSGEGIKDLKERTVDFGASDAPLSDAELSGMPAPVVQIPMTAGAVAIAYNLPNVPTGLKLAPDVLADIFLGKITKWNDPRITALNAGTTLPNLSITVVHRADGSGTTNIFTEYLSAISPLWSSKVGSGKTVSWPVGLGGKGNEGVAGTLTKTAGGIGYLELAYAQQKAMTIASLRNQAGEFVDPSVASTSAAVEAAQDKLKKDIRTPIINPASKDAYPISGLTYIMLYKEQPDAAKGTALVNFLWWATHDGQQYANDLWYAPLPEAVQSLDDALLKSVTSNGKVLYTEAPAAAPAKP